MSAAKDGGLGMSDAPLAAGLIKPAGEPTTNCGLAEPGSLAFQPELSRLPERPMRRDQLVLDLRERAVHLDRLLAGAEHRAAGEAHGRVFGVAAGKRQELRFLDAVDQAADIRPIERAGAHR